MILKNVTIELISFEDVYNSLRDMTKEHVALKKDSSTKYIGTFHGDRLIGCVGYQMIGSVLRYKGDFVDKEYRGNGIYTALWSKREELCLNIDKTKTTAFCTVHSLPKYLKEKFTIVSKHGNITFVKR